jgi:hypothetical protein
MTDTKRAGEAGAWTNAAAPLLEGWLRMGRVWVEASGRCSARMIAFLGERLEADLEHGRRLAECRDLAAVGQVQGQWLKAAVEDYRRELQALSEEMWAGLKAVREEAAEAMPMAAGVSGTSEDPAARPRERRAA